MILIIHDYCSTQNNTTPIGGPLIHNNLNLLFSFQESFLFLFLQVSPHIRGAGKADAHVYLKVFTKQSKEYQRNLSEYAL